MNRLRVFLITSVLLGMGLAPAASSRAAVIHVTTDTLNNVTVIEQNQTATINVRAFVDAPLSPNDGIFTFDQDLVLANIIANQPSILQVMSLNRPGVNDNLFTGSNGTPTPAGLSSIYGGYLPETIGIGSPALLFSVVVKGIAIGTESIVPGPSTVPHGFDFVLYQSSLTATSVTYDGGVLLQVIAANGGGGGPGGGGNNVPLPPALFVGLISGALLLTPIARRRFARP